MIAVDIISKVIAFMIIFCIGIIVYPIYLVLEILASFCRGILFIFGLSNFSTIWTNLKSHVEKEKSDII